MNNASSRTAFTNWIARDATRFALDSPEKAIDRIVAALGSSVELLGFGEALHGGEEILMLRNRIFQRLVEKHGYRALAIESAFPQSRHANDYITGKGDSADFNGWISNGMGLLEANRELIEWMRQYNAVHPDKLHFYGFDMPLGKMSFASPRFILDFVEDPQRRQRMEALIGNDADWENMEVIADPSKGVGLTPRATELRIEVENLVTEIRITHPGRSEALHYANICRQLLDAHAAMARRAGYSETLGIRDAIMADNLEYILAREGGRGKVMVFAHNSHLKRGQAEWQMGPVAHRWWPAGAHLSSILGPRYAVIGSGVGISEENGIAHPEDGTLEQLLMNGPDEALFIPIRGISEAACLGTTVLPVRTGSVKNPTYFPFTAKSLTDFDALTFVDSTTYQRGGPPLSAWNSGAKE